MQGRPQRERNRSQSSLWESLRAMVARGAPLEPRLGILDPPGSLLGASWEPLGGLLGSLSQDKGGNMNIYDTTRRVPRFTRFYFFYSVFFQSVSLYFIQTTDEKNRCEQYA